MLCKEFFDQSEYRRHSRIEHAFKCDQESCDYHLENQLSLINHKKKVHFIEPSNSYSSNWKLECEACGKSFAKTKIEWHKTLQHPGACAKYNLDCPLRFVTEAELIWHRKEVFRILLCRKVHHFLHPEPWDLDLHLDRKCTGSVTNVGNCLTANYNTTNM